MNINNKIQEIKETLRSGAVLSPGQYAEYHRILAGEYAFTSDDLGRMESSKNYITEQTRKLDFVKSDAQAERIYLASEEGQVYTRTRLKLKSLEKMLSSLKASIEASKAEWHNLIICDKIKT